jgi:transposase
MEFMGKSVKHSPEVRERAVRLVLEQQREYASQRAAIVSVAEKFGCSAETLRNWVRAAERQQIPEEQARLAERDWVKELGAGESGAPRANGRTTGPGCA